MSDTARVVFLEIDTERSWAVASIGPAFLASFLRQKGHRVDLRRVSPDDDLDDVAQAIADDPPDLIAVSMTTRQWLRGRDVVAAIRQRTAAPVIAGGLHPTFAPEEVLGHPGFDAVCLGEGEEALVDVAAAACSGQKLGPNLSIRNIWWRGGERPVLRPPFEPLEDLPFMARDLLDERYGVFHMVTQRGCPFPCTYCAARKYHDLYEGVGEYGRRRSHENVLDEVEALRRGQGLNYVIFLDDTFTIDPHWVREFCEIWPERTGAIPFSLHARVETVNRESIQRLADAGCRHITYGVESGSLRIRREVMKRPVKDQRFRDVFQWTKDAGILATANYMLGLPEETPEDIEMTLSLHEEIQPDEFGYFVFYPYPGTHLFRYCEEKGYLPDDWMDRPALHRESILDLPTITKQEIAAYYDRFTEARQRIYEGREGLSEEERNTVRADIDRCAQSG